MGYRVFFWTITYCVPNYLYFNKIQKNVNSQYNNYTNINKLRNRSKLSEIIRKVFEFHIINKTIDFDFDASLAYLYKLQSVTEKIQQGVHFLVK